MSVGERLKEVRERKGLSLRAAARLSEGVISHSQIAAVEKGTSPFMSLSFSAIRGLARAYELHYSDFIDCVLDAKPITYIQQRSIPLYSNLSAGSGTTSGKIIGEAFIDVSKTDTYVAYKVSGDSMAPKIPDSAITVIKVQEHAQPGDLVVMFCQHHGMIFKQLQSITDGHYVLTSFNLAYDPITIVRGKDCHIYGICTEYRVEI